MSLMKMLDSGDVAGHPYQTQFQAFFDVLDRGEDTPLTSFADGFATHRIIAAADRSARRLFTTAILVVGSEK
jgi:hypothetical protein